MNIEIIIEAGKIFVFELEGSKRIKQLLECDSKLELVSWLCEELDLL